MRRERNQYIFASELTKRNRSHRFRNAVLVLLPILIVSLFVLNLTVSRRIRVEEVKLTVLVDGAIDSDNTKEVIPAYSPYYTVSVKVKKDASIVVLLNDEKYREYKVNYDDNSVNLENSYSFTPKETEAVTEAPQVPDDQTEVTTEQSEV